jgi:hypothetical protein
MRACGCAAVPRIYSAVVFIASDNTCDPVYPTVYITLGKSISKYGVQYGIKIFRAMPVWRNKLFS